MPEFSREPELPLETVAVALLAMAFPFADLQENFEIKKKKKIEKRLQLLNLVFSDNYGTILNTENDFGGVTGISECSILFVPRGIVQST